MDELDKSWAFRFGEFFAGKANATFCAKVMGFAAFKLDASYGGKYNNLLTPSGMALLGWEFEQAHGAAPEAVLIHSMKNDVELWEDADMPSVCKYLRGAAGLNVPMELRVVLGMC
ncbi:unnamed protein product [Symbiodinium sp. CCMP2592]|nr:unnamed protein product [Symbiodinium sp. CCMP2592]